MRQNDLELVLIDERVERLLVRRRLEHRRKLQQKHTRAVDAKLLQLRQIFQPDAQLHLRTEQQLRHLLRQIGAQLCEAVEPPRQKFVDLVVRRVKMRRGDQRVDPGLVRQPKLLQRGFQVGTAVIRPRQNMRVKINVQG